MMTTKNKILYINHGSIEYKLEHTKYLNDFHVRYYD